MPTMLLKKKEKKKAYVPDLVRVAVEFGGRKKKEIQ